MDAFPLNSHWAALSASDSVESQSQASPTVSGNTQDLSHSNKQSQPCDSTKECPSPKASSEWAEQGAKTDLDQSALTAAESTSDLDDDDDNNNDDEEGEDDENEDDDDDAITDAIKEEVQRLFTEETRLSFEAWLESSEHKNLRRPPVVRQKNLLHFLHNPDAEAHTGQSRDKFDAKRKWMLLANAPDLIYRQPEPKFPRPRLLVPSSFLLDAIASEHIRLGHAGRNFMVGPINEKFYAITREEIMWVLGHCPTCAPRKEEKQRKTQATRDKKRRRLEDSDDDD